MSISPPPGFSRNDRLRYPINLSGGNSKAPVVGYGKSISSGGSRQLKLDDDSMAATNRGEIPKRKVGRPKGSKNKPKAEAVSRNTHELLKAIGTSKEPLVTKDGAMVQKFTSNAQQEVIPVPNQNAKRPRESPETSCFACMTSYGFERIRQEINGKAQSAAAVVCKLLEESPSEARHRGILGVVALLATAPSIEISRTLARYLGEDRMLAVVCKNYAAAFDLDTVARKAGQTITGAREQLCLDDIRPSIKVPGFIGSQNLLNLEPPSLPEGGEPQGFVGYAVNLVRIKSGFLKWRTCSGHGLRETLFYRLFGELQVYQNRESMMMARACIKDAAVSLDGSIIGNGLISTGRCEPDIIFPVTKRAEELLEARTLEIIDIDEESEPASNERNDKMFVESFLRYNKIKTPNGSLSEKRNM